MFRNFISWLDLYISRETPASVLKSLIGLMAFAGLLGTIFGSQAIRVGAFVVVIIFVISVILLLLADRRHLQQHHRTTNKLLTRYCDFVADNSSKPLVSMEAWNQVVYIQPNGDVKEIITVKSIALRKEVYFIRMPAGSGWDQPEQYRRNVEITARSLTVDQGAGPRWTVTTSWRSARNLTAILHLHEPIKHGQEICFEVVRTWPAKCRPLMRDDVSENFTFRRRNVSIFRHVEYKVVLPDGFDAVHELIGNLEPGVRLSVEDERDQEGRRIFTWRTDLVPADTVIGIRLELSGSRQ